MKYVINTKKANTMLFKTLNEHLKSEMGITLSEVFETFVLNYMMCSLGQDERIATEDLIYDTLREFKNTTEPEKFYKAFEMDLNRLKDEAIFTPEYVQLIKDANDRMKRLDIRNDNSNENSKEE